MRNLIKKANYLFSWFQRKFLSFLWQNFIKAKRYFVGEPVWMPYNRPADDMEARRDYLQKLQKGFNTPAVGIWCYFN